MHISQRKKLPFVYKDKVLVYEFDLIFYFNKERNLCMTKKSKLALINELPGIILKAAIAILILIICAVVIRGLKQEGFVFQEFQMPKKYIDSGLNGNVYSQMLADKIVELKNLSNKSDSIEIVVDNNKDLSLDVMGVGLSSSSMIFHIRDLLGIESNFISGDLVDLDNTIKLTVRMKGYPKIQVTEAYEGQNSFEAINSATEEAALSILGKLAPYKLALYHYYEKEYDKSEEIIRSIIKKDTNEKKWAYYLWSIIKQNERNTIRSTEYLNLALEEDPNFEQALIIMGWRYFQDRNYEKSLSYFKNLEKIDGGNFSTIQGLAFCNRNLGDLDEAEKYFSKNTVVNKQNVFAYISYMNFLMSTRKDTVKAISVIKKGAQDIHDPADNYMTLAGIYFMQDKLDSAAIATQNALEYDPNNVTALLQITNYNLNETKKYKEALTTAKRLSSILEEKSYDIGFRQQALNLVAISQFRLEQFDSSYINIQNSIELYPQNPYPISTLAEWYATQSNHKKFYEKMEEAVDLGYELSNLIETEEYKPYLNQKRFKDLVERSRANTN